MTTATRHSRRLGYDLPNALHDSDDLERACGTDVARLSDEEIATETWAMQRLLVRLRYERLHGRRYFVIRPDSPDGFQDADEWATSRLYLLRSEAKRRRSR